MRTNRWSGKQYANWLKAYLECLFDGRQVTVIENYKAQLELKLG